MKVLQEWCNFMLAVKTTGSPIMDEERGLVQKWKGKQKEKELEAGTWDGFEIYTGEKVDTAPLNEDFDKGLENFKKPVCFLDVGSGQ